jgi:hypothetical protein
MTGAFISPGEATLMDATARLAAVQTRMKEIEGALEMLIASMSLEKVDHDKHLIWVEGQIHKLEREISQVELLGRTPTHPNPDSSGGSE